ncbi:mediator of RNA polymerase II transcription subunit 18 isoform X2 [Lepisosteus oculatus]
MACLDKLSAVALLLLSSLTQLRATPAVRRMYAWVGDSVLLPCVDRGMKKLETYSWYYKKTSGPGGILLVSVERSGTPRYTQSRHWVRKKIQLNNLSLLIQDLREADGGVYSCTGGVVTSLTVFKDLPPVRKKLYVAAGDSIAEPCSGVPKTGGRTSPVQWSFQGIGDQNPLFLNSYSPSGGTDLNPERLTLLPNASVLIRDILRTHAGDYTCWIDDQNGHRKRLVTLTVCVLTVTADKASAAHSSRAVLNCTLLCESSEGRNETVLLWTHGNGTDLGPSVVNTITTTSTGVTATLEIPSPHNMSLRCSVRVRGEDRVSVEHFIHGHGVNNTGQQHTGISDASSGSVLLWTLTVCPSVFMSVLLLVFLCRRNAPIGNSSSVAHSCGSSGRFTPEAGEVESEAHYAAVEIRKPESSLTRTRAVEECVYSTLQFHSPCPAEGWESGQ